MSGLLLDELPYSLINFRHDANKLWVGTSWNSFKSFESLFRQIHQLLGKGHSTNCQAGIKDGEALASIVISQELSQNDCALAQFLAELFHHPCLDHTQCLQ